MKKIYISQPMRGRSTDEIIRERKQLIADAAVALRTDEVEVLDTLYPPGSKAKPLALLGRGIEKMAQADAVVFAPGWKDAKGCRVEHMAASEYELEMLEV